MIDKACDARTHAQTDKIWSFFFIYFLWAFMSLLIVESRLTGNGERDEGRYAAKVAQLGSRTGNAARAL